jgi:ParB family chromosome partitioning protein
LTARLFDNVASRGRHFRSDSALSVSAEVFNPKGGRVIASLDGVVRERLDDRRAAWEASGLTLVRWIHGFDEAEKLALVAELTALTLDLREERTSQIRGSARAEACELAQLSGADIAAHWTPDAPFLSAHSKTLLLGMLEAMGQADVRAGALGKADLVSVVEDAAAQRRWTPAALSLAGPEAPDGKADLVIADAQEGNERPEADDGAGAFEVTAEGEAALAQPTA